MRARGRMLGSREARPAQKERKTAKSTMNMMINAVSRL